MACASSLPSSITRSGEMERRLLSADRRSPASTSASAARRDSHCTLQPLLPPHRHSHWSFLSVFFIFMYKCGSSGALLSPRTGRPQKRITSSFFIIIITPDGAAALSIRRAKVRLHRACGVRRRSARPSPARSRRRLRSTYPRATAHSVDGFRPRRDAAHPGWFACGGLPRGRVGGRWGSPAGMGIPFHPQSGAGSVSRRWRTDRANLELG